MSAISVSMMVVMAVATFLATSDENYYTSAIKIVIFGRPDRSPRWPIFSLPRA
jgi:hypothetical protein